MLGRVIKRLYSTKKPIIVPKVQDTDHLDAKAVHTEGLFAGSKPLFLGNSSIETDAVSVKSTVEEIFNDLTGPKQDTSQPVIPWDASIGGMLYNDRPFKDVPRDVVGSLKPFKLKKPDPGPPAPPGNFHIHNTKINDQSEFIDLNSRSPDSLSSNAGLKTNVKPRHKKFSFIRSDNQIYKNEVDRFNVFLSKEFLKISGVAVHSEFNSNFQLPLYIYIDNSIVAELLFKCFLQRSIRNHCKPLLTSIMAAKSPEAAEKFKQKTDLKIAAMCKRIMNIAPSLRFTAHGPDVILSESNVKGFGRMYWIDREKRWTTFWDQPVTLKMTHLLEYTNFDTVFSQN